MATMPGVALGHRRLSIIDVAGGHQPLSNEDGSVWIVFNGEIYNFRELRRRLEGAGHRFRTHSDTEVIVHLYEDEGLDFLEHLNGMFALAIWDARQRRLVLARDRLGKKPLVYRHEPGRLLFASELKSLLEVPGVPREIDPQALDEYLTYQYVPHPRTIFRGISQAAAGALCRVRRRPAGRAHCYWQPDFDRESRSAAGRLRGRAARAAHLGGPDAARADVPLGAFLSGGVDSSIDRRADAAAVDAAGEDVLDRLSGAGVRRNGRGPRGGRAAGHEHHEFRVEPDASKCCDKLVWHYDEPFADSSAMPT